MRKYLIFSSLMASCALFGAEETLKEIVVTGTASPTSNQSIETLVNKTKPLSVISEQQLQRSVGKSVLEMISQEPGVSMVNDGMD